MVFQFEHMDVDADADNKWTDKKMDLREMKAVLTKWQKGLEDIAWNSPVLGESRSATFGIQICR